MAEDPKISISDALTGLGFTAQPQADSVIFTYELTTSQAELPNYADETQENPPDLKPFPISLKRWELTLQNGIPIKSELVTKIDLGALLTSLKMSAASHFPTLENSTFLANSRGEIWCLFEFSKPNSNDAPTITEAPLRGSEIPVGLGGFRLHLNSANRLARAIITDHLGLGYLPKNFFGAIPEFVTSALGIAPSLRKLETREDTSLFEVPFRLELAGLSAIAQSSNPNHDKAIASIFTAIVTANFANGPTVSFAEKSWVIDNEAFTISSSSLRRSRVPLEVLESRECEPRFRKVDRLIVERDLVEAQKVCEQLIIQNPKSVFLFRRMSFLGLAGAQHNHNQKIRAILEHEPTNKLLMSHEILRALRDEENVAALEQLSRIGECLIADGISPDETASFDVVFPELLGDAWTSEDQEVAAACYGRVLQTKGEIPRLLHKLIGIRHSQCQVADEASLLDRLAKVESRKFAAAKISLRQAELCSKDADNIDRAIDLALKSLQYDRSLHQAALLAAELLTSTRRYEEAIELLSDVIRDAPIAMTKISQAKMELKIADIWHSKLARPDLAIPRFERAMELDPTQSEATAMLSMLYEEDGRFLELAELLLGTFASMDHPGNDSQLWDVFERLANVYIRQLQMPDRANELFQRFLKNVDPMHEVVSKAVEFPIIADWSDFVVRLKARVLQMGESPDRSKYLCLLAKILRSKIKATAEATNYLILAVKGGWIEPAQFRILCDELHAMGKLDDLALCLRWQLTRAEPLERRDLIVELLKLTDRIDEAEIDALILELYSPSPDDQDRLRERLDYHRRQLNFDSILNMMKQLFKKRIGTIFEIKWLRYWNMLIEDASWPLRLQILDDNFRRLLSLGDDEREVSGQAVHVFKDQGSRETLAFYVAHLLRAGLLPDVNQDTVTALFADRPYELALYYERRSYSASDKSQSASWARSAAVLLDSIPGTEAKRERLLARVATSIHCTDSTLQSLKDLVSQSGHWFLYADALREQIAFTRKRSELDALKTELAFVYRYRTREPGLARAVYESMLKTADDISYILLQLAEIGGEVQDEQLAIQSLKGILQEQDPLSDIDQYCTAASRLYSIVRDYGSIDSILTPHLEGAVQRRDWNTAGKLAHTLLEIGVCRPSLWMIRFKEMVTANSTDSMSTPWLQGLLLIEAGIGIQEYVAETRKFLSARDKFDDYVELLKFAYESASVKSMTWDVRNELIYAFACALFDSKSRVEQSLAVFQEYFEHRPDDRRVWLPIYFLLREFGTSDERIRHLETILPVLTLDASVLSRYPITIESLERELRYLKSGALASGLRDSIASGGYEASGISAVSQLISEEQILRDQEIDESRLHSVLSPGIRHEMSTHGGRTNTNLTVPPDKNPDNHSHQQVSSGDPEFSLISASAADRLGASDRESRLRELLDVDPLSRTNEIVELNLTDSDPADDGRNFDNAQIEVTVTDSGPVNIPFADLPILDHERSDLSADQVAAPDQIEHGVRQLELPLEIQPDEGQPLGPQDGKRAIELQQIDTISIHSLFRGEGSPEGSNPAFGQIDGSNGSSKKAAKDPEEDGEIYVAPAGFVPLVPNIASLESLKVDSSISGTAPSVLAKLDVQGMHDRESSLNHGDSDAGGVQSSENPAYIFPNRAGESLRSDSQNDERKSTSEDQAQNVVNWKALATDREPRLWSVEAAWATTFVSETEKHIALQIAAVKTGNVRALRDWKWPSWRNLDQCDYPMVPEVRLGPDTLWTNPVSPLYRLVTALTPTMIRAFRDQFSTDGMLKRYGISRADFQAVAREVAWNSDLPARSGIHLFGESYREQQQRLVALKGLGPTIFFDPIRKVYYFDDSYYVQMPPSHFFHRMRFIAWALKRQYFALLQLDVQKCVIPLISEVEKILHPGSSGRLKRIFPGSSTTMSKLLESSNLESLKGIYKNAGAINGGAVEKLWSDLNQAMLELCLSESLDFLGLCESICNRDFLIQELRPGEALMMSPSVERLIKFATTLKFDHVANPRPLKKRPA